MLIITCHWKSWTTQLSKFYRRILSALVFLDSKWNIIPDELVKNLEKTYLNLYFTAESLLIII